MVLMSFGRSPLLRPSAAKSQREKLGVHDVVPGFPAGAI